ANATTGDNTINFSVTGTITLNSALPDLSNTTGLTDIEGPGAASLTVARTIGAPEFRIFTVDAGVNAKLVGLTLIRGQADQGGGIFGDGGTVALTGVTLTHDAAVGADGVGGAAAGGGLYARDATVTLNDVTISNVSARGGAGGPSGSGGVAQGGALYVSGGSL